ncbi:MAG TPA: hypothetical protein VKO18_11460 [Terriglobia bacterium]|nr:hypothetical protein [Terriglobia bacterium]
MTDFYSSISGAFQQATQGRGGKVSDVKWHMPINPTPPQCTPQPTLTIRTTDPHLSAGSKNAMNILQHLPGIQRVLQYIGQNSDPIGIRGNKILQQTRMNREAGFAGQSRGSFIELKAFHLKAVPTVDPQTATFVATDVEKTPRPAPLIERYVAIKKRPEAV